MAEPEASVDVDGVAGDGRLLLRCVLPGLLAGVDGGGAAVPDGLPEEWGARSGRGIDAVEVHDAGGRDGEGQPVFLLGDQIERTTGAEGKPGYRLTDEGVKAGLVRLELVPGSYNDRAMHALLSRWVFKHDDIWGYMARPFGYSLVFFVLLLFVAVPKHRRG